MATALSDQLTGLINPTANAGLAGAPVQNRAVDTRGRMRVKRFSFTIPASGAGSASGDVVRMLTLFVTDRIYMLRLFHDAMGSANTLDAGKEDPNNSSNTSATRYISGADSTGIGMIDAVSNMTEQVGVDPLGDQSTGNVVPGFGSQPVWITVTIHGTPTAAKVIQGFVMYSSD